MPDAAFFLPSESNSIAHLKPLLHPTGNGPQIAIHFAGVLSKNQADNGLTSNVDVLEAAKDVNFLVREYNCFWLEAVRNHEQELKRTSCSASVFNGEFGLAVLAGDTANGAAEMFTRE